MSGSVISLVVHGLSLSACNLLPRSLAVAIGGLSCGRFAGPTTCWDTIKRYELVVAARPDVCGSADGFFQSAGSPSSTI